MDIKPAEDNYNDPEMLGHGHGHGHSHGHGEEGDTADGEENSGDDTSESNTESEGSTKRYKKYFLSTIQYDKIDFK